MYTVCHLTSAHKSDDVRIYYKECTSLSKNGYTVYLVAQGDSYVNNGVHIIGIGEIPHSRLKRSTYFVDKVLKSALAIDADIYHLHDPELIRIIPNLKEHNKIVIFDSHEDTFHSIKDKTYIPVLLRDIISYSYVKYAKKVLKQCDALISVTPSIVDYLKQINPNTYMITNYPFYSNNCKHDITHGSMKLCFTGGISKQWNHDRIVSIINSIPNVEYDVCGSIEEKKYENYSNDKVHIYGKLPHDKAIKIQRQSDVGMALLLPSNNTNGNEGTLGNTKIFEYMNSGLPIICTNFRVWQSIVDRYKCGICVNPYSDTEICNAILYMQSHGAERIQMGINGNKAIKNEYNWAAQERILLNLYEKLERKNK